MRKHFDSLVGHCLVRAAAAGHDGGSANWAAIKAAPKATRVAAFITDWATLVYARNGADPLPVHAAITLYCETFGTDERTTYRRLHDFRELWPEHETPEPIARLLADSVDRRSLEAAGPLITVSL